MAIAPVSRSLYQRRFEKELAVTAAEIDERSLWSLPVLSENSKCSVSLDLPLTHCQPTKACAAVCYASQGTQYFRKSVVKSLAVARLIERDPEHVARKMIDEAEGRIIRIAGSGELLPRHKELLDYVEQFGGSWWGFTRRVDTHRELPSLMFSFDATTPRSVMAYVREQVPVHRRAYLRRVGDPESSLAVAVTFPVHGSLTPQVDHVPNHDTDCPSTRGYVAGCWACKRCY